MQRLFKLIIMMMILKDEQPGSVVVPMADSASLAGEDAVPWQVVESLQRPPRQGTQLSVAEVPPSMLEALPGSVGVLNQWLRLTVNHDVPAVHNHSSDYPQRSRPSLLMVGVRRDAVDSEVAPGSLVWPAGSLGGSGGDDIETLRNDVAGLAPEWSQLRRRSLRVRVATDVVVHRDAVVASERRRRKRPPAD